MKKYQFGFSIPEVMVAMVLLSIASLMLINITKEKGKIAKSHQWHIILLHQYLKYLYCISPPNSTL